MTDRDATGEEVTGKLLPGAVLAGYRLVRRVGSDSGRERWLAYSEGRALTVVVTVCREDEAVRRWTTTHSTVRSPHVLRLLDVASLADCRVLLVAEQTDWTVATLLSSRAQLAAGEAVTILAPVTAGLAAIHAAGFVHGGLTVSTVFFTADGRPVIARLHSCDNSLVDRSADYRALSALVRAVAGVLEEGARKEFVGLAEWLESTIEESGIEDSLAGQMECRIFSLAPPLPVVLIADRRPSAAHADSPALGRYPVTLRGVGVVSAALSAMPGVPMALDVLGHLGVGGWLRRLVQGRGPLIGMACVLAAVIGGTGLMLIPSGRESASVAPAPGSAVALPDPAVPDPAVPDPAVEGSGPGRRDGPVFTPAEVAATTGEGPVSATGAVLALRARCAATQDVACLERYAEVGSPAAEADRFALESTFGATMLLLDARERDSIALVLRSEGDVVLLRVIPADEKRQPVLALVVRTDTGWRLRDLFPED